MSERLPTRREVASEQFEQTNQFETRQQLIRIGLFKELGKMELYHGRAGDGGNTWSVNPDFNNSDNNTGHYNINKKPALNTANYSTARKFSIARSQDKYSIAEVHRIVSDDKDAVVIDGDAFYQIDWRHQKTVNKMIAGTLPGLTEGAPLRFEDRDVLRRTRPTDYTNKYGLVFSREIDALSRKLQLDKSTVRHIGSAINTIKLFQSGYTDELCRAFLKNEPGIDIDIHENGTCSLPINHEYIAYWLKKNHIVGYKMKVNSATINQKVDNYILFDLEKVNTKQELEKESHDRFRKFGKIAKRANENLSKNRGNLADILSQYLYLKPQEIIHLAKQTPGFKSVFESDAGNWEKYKLEEHTETALRLFDDNYADKLPASMIPVMRMAILVHDLGKPESVRRNNKKNQKIYNEAFADYFLRKNNVDEPTIKLIISMIGDGMDWTHRWMVKRDKTQGEEFQSFCEGVMKRYLNKRFIGQKTVMGFRNMLEILQTCDSAAYTTMAVTRTNNGVYRNYGSFDRNFKPNHGLDGRSARMIQ